MTPLPTRVVYLDPKVHTAFNDYAWSRRATMGDVVRQILDNIREGKADDSILSVDDRSGAARLGIRANPDAWDEARDIAHNLGISHNKLIRLHIIKLLKEEGFLE